MRTRLNLRIIFFLISLLIIAGAVAVTLYLSIETFLPVLVGIILMIALANLLASFSWVVNQLFGANKTLINAPKTPYKPWTAKKPAGRTKKAPAIENDTAPGTVQDNANKPGEDETISDRSQSIPNNSKGILKAYQNGERNFSDFSPDEPHSGIAAFKWTVLDGVDFSRAHLSSVPFDGTSLIGARFIGTNLKGGSFRGAVLRQADLSWADLSGVDLSGADLSGANLSYASVEDAIMDNAILVGCTISPEQFVKVRTYKGAIFPDGSRH